VLITLALALLAVNAPAFSHVLTIMDGSWTDVVQERSQFLFLQLWTVRDWLVNARPFIYLAFTAFALPDERIRKLCFVAALVGGAGLAVAFIGDLIGPIAILVQGQAWRWIWIGVFVSAALAPLTLLKVWRDEKCGPLCALLMVSGWTLPAVYGIPCALLGFIVWRVRARMGIRLASQRWVSAALGVAIVVIVAWTLVRCWAIVSPPTAPSGAAPSGLAQIRDIFALRIPAVLLSALVWWAVRARRTTWAPMVLSAMLGAFSLLILPAAFRQGRALGAAAEIQEFENWENVIPPTSTVLVAPPRDVGTFVWFTLARPNYLALDQSSGVVFSRTTSLEVRRRSEVLLPLMDSDWKIRTGLAKFEAARKKEAVTRPLTRKSLIAVCTDPQLGFVISPENVGFNPIRHEQAGAWKDWNLYDCRKVRLALPAT
jgi:hypothetical protein